VPHPFRRSLRRGGPPFSAFLCGKGGIRLRRVIHTPIKKPPSWWLGFSDFCGTGTPACADSCTTKLFVEHKTLGAHPFRHSLCRGGPPFSAFLCGKGGIRLRRFTHTPIKKPPSWWLGFSDFCGTGTPACADSCTTKYSWSARLWVAHPFPRSLRKGWDSLAAATKYLWSAGALACVLAGSHMPIYLDAFHFGKGRSEDLPGSSPWCDLVLLLP
jgi:hypothetical protein